MELGSVQFARGLLSMPAYAFKMAIGRKKLN
jgi:hypothetical protein